MTKLNWSSTYNLYLALQKNKERDPFCFYIWGFGLHKSHPLCNYSLHDGYLACFQFFTVEIMLHYDLHLFIHMSTSLEKILGSTTSIDSLLFSTRDCPPKCLPGAIFIILLECGLLEGKGFCIFCVFLHNQYLLNK